MTLISKVFSPGAPELSEGHRDSMTPGRKDFRRGRRFASPDFPGGSDPKNIQAEQQHVRRPGSLD